MAKINVKKETQKPGRANKSGQKVAATTTQSTEVKTVSELRQDSNLSYKICALIYDLKNMAKDKSCENRTLQTTDALYISAPYFTPGEAAIVKAALVDRHLATTVEDKITSDLATFFEKRRASGDSRPCGPHDMVPGKCC